MAQPFVAGSACVRRQFCQPTRCRAPLLLTFLLSHSSHQQPNILGALVLTALVC